MNRAENRPLDPDLGDALGALREEQAALSAPVEVEDRVMRAWDDKHRPSERARVSFGPSVLATAAAGVLAVTLGYWWTSGVRKPSGAPAVKPAAAALSWPSEETLAWLGADPASLQVVRIRVASKALAQYGYAISDPDGNDLVDVEMIVGPDGIAQTARLRQATSPSGRSQ